MVKFFSVDWLAQSHNEARTEETDTTFKPHVPCMVQPSAPSYGKGYLQPKPRGAKNPESSAKNPERSAKNPESSAKNPESSAKNPESSAEPGLCSPRLSCASPVSEISEYSSGYESEAASSECSAADDAQNQRRVRTKFTPEQISKLEKIFLKHKYLDAGERVKTAHKLNLTETQVRTWFQNRRMKLKREVQDFLAPQVTPMLLHAFPPALQYRRPPFVRSHPAPGFYPLPVPHMHQQHHHHHQQQHHHHHHQQHHHHHQQHHHHQHQQQMMIQHPHFY